MQLTLTMDSPGATRDLARRIGGEAWPGMLILLDGPLGAGKTHFVQGLGQGLGVKGPVTSPSFIIMDVHQGRIPLIHADLYRLNDPGEEEALGLWDYADTSVTAIEWAEKLGYSPQEALRVRLEPLGETSRRVLLETGEGPGDDPRYGELVKSLAQSLNLTVEDKA